MSGLCEVETHCYRAPEFRFPIPVNDCFDGLKWVSLLIRTCRIFQANTSQSKETASSLGVDPEKIIILGGSAGANLVGCLPSQGRRNFEELGLT